MKLPHQSPRFRRRMMPLALLVGLLVGILLPWVNQARLRAEQVGECTSWAQQLGVQLGRHASKRPTLWAYDRPVLERLTEGLIRPPLQASVTLDTPTRSGIFRVGPKRQTTEVSGWAPVLREGETIGRVEVRLDAEAMQTEIYQTWVVGSGLGLILSITLFFLPSATVRRGDAQSEALWSALLEANAQLEGRVLARTLELRRLGTRLLEIQEEERRRLSRDLHDDLGQILTGLRLRLTALSASGIGESAQQQLASAIEAVDLGVDQVRRLAHHLRPPALDSLGLADGLRSVASEWAVLSQLELTLSLDNVPMAPMRAETIFRVAQEAMTNISRHAQASHVEIRLWQAEGWIHLRIDDDGVGLNHDHQMDLGLIGIRERLASLDGSFTLTMSALGGVCFHAQLPLEGDGVT